MTENASIGKDEITKAYTPALYNEIIEYENDIDNDNKFKHLHKYIRTKDIVKELKTKLSKEELLQLLNNKKQENKIKKNKIYIQQKYNEMNITKKMKKKIKKYLKKKKLLDHFYNNNDSIYVKLNSKNKDLKNDKKLLTEQTFDCCSFNNIDTKISESQINLCNNWFQETIDIDSNNKICKIETNNQEILKENKFVKDDDMKYNDNKMNECEAKTNKIDDIKTSMMDMDDKLNTLKSICEDISQNYCSMNSQLKNKLTNVSVVNINQNNETIQIIDEIESRLDNGTITAKEAKLMLQQLNV